VVRAGAGDIHWHPPSASDHHVRVAAVAPLRPLSAPATLGEAFDQLAPAGMTALAGIDEAISEDLNTPRVLAQLHAVLREDAIPARDRALIVGRVEQLLGLSLDRTAAEEVVDRSAGSTAPAERVEELPQPGTTGAAGLDACNRPRLGHYEVALDVPAHLRIAAGFTELATAV
jgi:hypothetical protein